MDEQNVIYTKEQYTALKRKDIPSHTTPWMSLEDVMLSEINQSPRGQILCDSTFMRSPEESHWVGATG